MTRLRVLWSRALDLLVSGRRERRLQDEIREHLQLLTEDHVARGMSYADARAAAHRSFGSVAQIADVYRDQRGLPSLDAAWQDLRFAVRLMRRDPAFTATAVLVLALGIGVNNMLFTILNAHTLRGLPVRDADRVLFMSTFDDRSPDRGVSYRDFIDWRSAATSVSSMAAFTSGPVIVSEPERAADRFDGAFISASSFSLIGVQPVLGRDFTREDDRPGAAAVVILGRDVWRSRYDADPGVLGRSVIVNGAPATIVGVMPERTGFPATAQIWLPLSQVRGLDAQPRSARPLRVVARAAGDRSVSETRAEIEAVADRLAREHPDTNRNLRARVVPINEQFLGSPTNPAWLAFMTTGCLMVLISCANAANLMLARSARRAREMAIRTSIGASRRRLTRQLLIEGAVLAALGGIAGLGVALAGVRLFSAAIPERVLPYWFDYSLDLRVLAALIGVSAASVFLFALLPALQASKSDVTLVMKDGGRTGTRRGRHWTTGFLAIEFGLTVVLLAHFVVNVRTAAPALETDRALDTDQVLAAAITLPAEGYPSAAQRQAFFDALQTRLGGLPAVSGVAIANALPLSGGDEARVDLEGRPRTADDSPGVRTVAITPGYFETFGLTLVRGRDLEATDGDAGRPHVVVNERFVEQFLGQEEAIGRRISLSDPNAPVGDRTWSTIVGVAPSIRQRPGPSPDAVVYTPFRSTASTDAHLLVRSDVETGALASLLREEVAGVDRSLPLYRLRTMAQVVRDAQWNGRVANGLFVLLTSIAAILATIGLYAVTAHSIVQRTQEIGVRMALGASSPQIVQLVARRVALQLSAGLFTGILGAKVWGATLGSGRDGVTTTDPISILAVAAILTLLAAIACFVPARRAIRLDPVAAIRHD